MRRWSARLLSPSARAMSCVSFKDKLMAEFIDSDLDHLQRNDWKEVIQIVADAPTVIEAEGSEE